MTMKVKSRVDLSVEKFSKNKNSGFLSKVFKKTIIKKFKNIEIGHITLVDKDEVYTFGDSSSSMKAKVEVLSSDFYVMLGSGGSLGVAEAYAASTWRSDDLVMLIRIVIKNTSLMNQLESVWARLLEPLNSFLHWRRKNSLSGSKENILAHYDLSNDFYRLWLDRTMTYSCGIFNDKSSSMEDASIEKLDRICRKLNISPEDSILEIGTGWGSFSIHAAKKYGCSVTTTTISDAQYKFALQRIKDEGLTDKVRLLKEDYRKLSGKFNKVVSIEMIEAVGHEFVPLYFKKVSSLLKNDGLFAMQGITYNDQNFDVYKKSVDFIKKYIFPGSCLISIAQVAETIKTDTDLSLVDLEDITVHYARTLKAWRLKFLKELDKVKKIGFSNEFINIWEFYFVYCEAGFLERNIGDYQFVFSKPSRSNIQIEY
ncbi:MAG: hypothetical protein CBD58_01550 [bacterium TMED198]|nr:MAG: hypothetical protein CBD58_01550 [bacterium TMED198]|tara:strand:+ start:821 stop:2098 length:1278 start_codon:yes stop_codon:yes gene_type:complete